MSMFGASLRLMRAGATLTRHDALLPREYRDRLPAPGRWLGDVLRLFAFDRGGSHGVRLAAALESMGPVWIKFGQMLGTRPDLIGPAAADLARLKDRLPPFSEKAARAALVEEFGAEQAALLFPDLGPPAAAASIAQTHKMRLPDGSLRAVKILRPGIEQAVAKDLEALRLAAALAESFVPDSKRLEPRAFIAEVAQATLKEIDLRIEAAAADEFREILAKDGHLSAPKIDWTRSGRRVVTLDWVQGIALSDEAALDRAGADKVLLARKLVQGFLASALDHGFFHADMHEGNFILGDDGRLWAVDFGIMGRIGPGERKYLAEILWGFIQRDYHRIAAVHFEAGYVTADKSVDDFALALRAVGEPIQGKTADGVSMARVLLQLFDVTAQFGMHLRPELVLLQKTMAQVEGMGRTLDPRLDLWNIAKPVVGRWINSELGPAARARRLFSDAGGAAAALRRLPEAVERIEARLAHLDARQTERPRNHFGWWALALGLCAASAAAGAILARGFG
jgi:ubiquinone biosynthesis protein